MSRHNPKSTQRWKVFATALLSGAFATLLVILTGSSAPSAHASDGPEIVGGKPVPNGKYPFVAALLNTRRGKTAYRRHICGATLINRNHVLTAAHCVKGKSARQLRVTVGRTVLDSKQGKQYRVVRISIEPRYNKRNHRNDAAVLKLRGSSHTRPIKLAARRQHRLQRPGRIVRAAGWGDTIKAPPSGPTRVRYPERMRQVRVPIVSDARAKRVYGRHYAPTIMIAAGRNGKGVCYGDSGGPLFTRTPRGYVQIGITSFGIGCAAKGYPAVYTQVNAAHIRHFILHAARR